MSVRRLFLSSRPTLSPVSLLTWCVFVLCLAYPSTTTPWSLAATVGFCSAPPRSLRTDVSPCAATKNEEMASSSLDKEDMDSTITHPPKIERRRATTTLSLWHKQAQVNRRVALALAGGTTVSSLWVGAAHPAATMTARRGGVGSDSVDAALASANPLQVLSNVQVTHRVAMNVRISRSDGTFYVRDDLDESNPDNCVFYGRLVLGLFGKVAPIHVQQFLRYVTVPAISSDENDDEGPLPSYSRSLFTSFDQATGLLGGGVIPGYNVVSIGGSSALQYGKRILEAPLWIETADTTTSDARISHSALSSGLLTHKTLDLLPTFGITTRKGGAELDATRVVFGQVLPDERNEGMEFLQRCQDLPTYSMDRPSSNGVNGSAEEMALEQVASQVYSFQKDLFRSAAKSFGDSRLDKVYQGKLLRRVEVTNVQVL